MDEFDPNDRLHSTQSTQTETEAAVRDLVAEPLLRVCDLMLSGNSAQVSLVASGRDPDLGRHRLLRATLLHTQAMSPRNPVRSGWLGTTLTKIVFFTFKSRDSPKPPCSHLGLTSSMLY